VKPNPNKVQLGFEGGMVLEQLTYSGVFEAITIRKQGFPFRLTHADFFQRYKVRGIFAARIALEAWAASLGLVRVVDRGRGCSWTPFATQFPANAN